MSECRSAACRKRDLAWSHKSRIKWLACGGAVPRRVRGGGPPVASESRTNTIVLTGQF